MNQKKTGTLTKRGYHKKVALSVRVSDAIGCIENTSPTSRYAFAKLLEVTERLFNINFL